MPLQWGRAHMGAEIALKKSGQVEITLLQWGRAPVNAEMARALINGVSEHVASMGPRSCERGNMKEDNGGPALRYQLQWGRAQTSAEMAPKSVNAEYDYRLQWGRAPVSAEISYSI